MKAVALSPSSGPAVAIGQDGPSILEAAAQPDTHLALWRRPLPDTLDWIERLDWDGIDDLSFIAPIVDIDMRICAALVDAGYPNNARGAAFAMEMAGLAKRFAAIFDLAAVKVRLEVIETDACRKFHADHVMARLLSTYFGQGTQWKYAPRGHGMSIHQMRTGDVGIFRGRLAAAEPAILHRSPPIVAHGETRLLLAIDPAEAMPSSAVADAAQQY